MCLLPEWFNDKPNRKKRWDERGVSNWEVRDALSSYNSTVYPVAIEMAMYVIDNWNAYQIATLDPDSKSILFKVWDGYVKSKSFQEQSEKAQEQSEKVQESSEKIQDQRSLDLPLFLRRQMD